MTSMLADMLNSSLTKFASQLKSGSEGQGDSEPTQNVPSDHEKGPSDHDDHSEGRDLASVEELSEAPGDPQLENLKMTEEEQRDFETFTLASPTRAGVRPFERPLKRIRSFILRPSRPALAVSRWLARRVH